MLCACIIWPVGVGIVENRDNDDDGVRKDEDEVGTNQELTASLGMWRG